MVNEREIKKTLFNSNLGNFRASLYHLCVANVMFLNYLVSV